MDYALFYYRVLVANILTTYSRMKGTPNKVTSDIRDAYRRLLEENLANLNSWLSEIAQNNPEKAIDLLLKMSEYVVPKLNRTEIESTSINDLMSMTMQQREQRISELIKKQKDQS